LRYGLVYNYTFKSSFCVGKSN